MEHQTVKVFHGTEVKRFRFEKSSELTYAKLMDIITRDFQAWLTGRNTFKYMDDDGDLCTLTESTYSDAFSQGGEFVQLYVCEPVHMNY